MPLLSAVGISGLQAGEDVKSPAMSGSGAPVSLVRQYIEQQQAPP